MDSCLLIMCEDNNFDAKIRKKCLFYNRTDKIDRFSDKIDRFSDKIDSLTDRIGRLLPGLAELCGRHGEEQYWLCGTQKHLTKN